MNSYVKYVLAAVALLFSAAGLCGNPNWPDPPKAQKNSGYQVLTIQETNHE